MRHPDNCTCHMCEPPSVEVIKIRLGLVRNDKCVSITLDESQKQAIMKFIRETGLLFTQRQNGIDVKMFITGTYDSRK
jgi:hypothetical protein